MDFYEVYEIGRESVKSVNASILATLIKELVNKFEQNHKSKLQHYKYHIKCKEKLELIPKKSRKIGDDEGFESDINEEDSLSGDISNEDAQSTTSSCCLVEDHVFKSNKSSELIHRLGLGRNPISTSSIVGSTDSANSSGSSDTDELDIHSLTPSPVNRTSEKLLRSNKEYLKRTEINSRTNKKEEFPIADVIFCHTEPKYPTVIAWVIKKHRSEFDVSSRLGKTGVENIPKNENCLEVIVIKCRNSDNLRELCSNYQEFSKRIKLDQYKSINRRKDVDQKSVSLANLIESKDVKVSLSDMKIANSNLIKASELSILNPKIMTSFKTDIKNSISLNSLLKPEMNLSQKFKNSQEAKLSIYQPKEETVKKAQSLSNVSKGKDFKSDTVSRNAKLLKEQNKDISDQFNLVQRTDLNGVTHLEVSKGGETKSSNLDKFSNKSKIRKEIEGVILTDVDSYIKKEQVRQRQSPILVNDKLWRPDDSVDDIPPIRPERRKKKAPSPPTDTKSTSHLPSMSDKSKSTFYLSVQDNDENDRGQQRIVKGQYIRVQSWGNQNVCEPNLGSWKGEPKERLSRKSEEKYVDRRRSRSVGKFGKKTPMAYRYIDITDDSNQYQPNNSSRLYGISQKIKEISGNVVNNANTRRRRNSFDDVINFDNRSKGNLKSVIKKNKKINDKFCEPKKVTFSAFATVQVVD